MGEMKDKMKSLMKSVSNTFSSSSSSSSFKGQGHILGSSTGTATGAATGTAASNPSKLIQNPPRKIPAAKSPKSNFDPFDSLVSSVRTNLSPAAAAFACPVCSLQFPSESAVSAHLDSCASNPVAAYLAANPPAASVEVIKRLLANVVKEPGNDKYRRIRLGNPKIKEAVVDVEGAVEVLKWAGFRMDEEEGGEIWAAMEVPDEEGVTIVKEAVQLLDSCGMDRTGVPAIQNGEAVASGPVDDAGVREPEMIDRQIRVFFSIPEDVGAMETNLPDSFYNLTPDEISNEARMRRQRLEESRLLIPKSYKEKQALAAKKKHKRTVLRIQFPDAVVLQATFLPTESTTALYKFVAAALKEPGLEFKLLRAAVGKLRLIPQQPRMAGQRVPTLEDEELVPSALIKFKPLETDSALFTGLTDELLENMEPLTNPS